MELFHPTFHDHRGGHLVGSCFPGHFMDESDGFPPYPVERLDMEPVRRCQVEKPTEVNNPMSHPWFSG